MRILRNHISYVAMYVVMIVLVGCSVNKMNELVVTDAQLSDNKSLDNLNLLTSQTYWVAPGGNDSNPGTETSPWKTPQKAATTAQAGDIVYFKAGTYNITQAITIANSGTSGAWITFSAAPGFARQAIFTGTAGTHLKGAWFASGKSYIKLEGLTIQKITNGSGIWIRGREAGTGTGSASGIRVVNCKIDSVSNIGIAITGVPFTEDGTLGTPNYNITTDVIVEDCDVTKTNETSTPRNECISVGEGVGNIIVRNNTVYESNQYGIDFKEGVDGGAIYGNTVYGLEKHGIYLDAIGKWDKNIDIYNNKIYNVGGAGITLAREKDGSTSTLQNIRVFNNIIYDTDKEGVMLYNHTGDLGGGVLDNIKIMNNTIYNGISRNGIRVVHPYISLATVYVFNNIVYQTALAPLNLKSEVVASNNLINTDPMFVNETARNFKIKNGSPAINTGTGTNAPSFDFIYATRPKRGGYDISAYEY